MFIQEGRLIERGVFLQIRSIVDEAFFLDTREAIEKTTNLHYNLFICFILDHSDLRYHFHQLKSIPESSAFALQVWKALPFLNNGFNLILRTIICKVQTTTLKRFYVFLGQLKPGVVKSLIGEKKPGMKLTGLNW